jgi:tetratricopeptide (TPR) repeat protein
MPDSSDPGLDGAPADPAVVSAGDQRARKLQEITIFISSPGDVGEEREIAARVIKRLAYEFQARAKLTPILWENQAIVSTDTFQKQISRTSEADIVVCILWTRLGTRLPQGFETRPDGTPYESGTAFEFEDAQAAFDRTGKPDLLAYRKNRDPQVSVKDPEQLKDFHEQWQALDRFINGWFRNEDGTFKRGFHEFETADKFERKLTDHLRELILKQLLPTDGDDEGISWSTGSPFKGLEVFEPEDAPIYFGRTRAVSEIIEQAAARAAAGIAFLPIFGMSGSGKSSLLRAGVIATLTGPDVVNGAKDWRYCIIRPSDNSDIFLGLAVGLMDEKALPGLAKGGLSPARLADTLRDAPDAAATLIAGALADRAAARPDAAPGSSRLLLVLDQMEELFTSKDHDEAARSALFKLLFALASASTADETADPRPADLVWVISAVRGDFYHRCVQADGFTRLVGGDGPYHLLPPRSREIRDIILRPAEAAGLYFEFDPGRATSLDLLIEDEAVNAPHALPLLEFMLQELYERRWDERVLKLDAYDELGGLNGALGKRADQVFDEQPPEVQAALPQVLGLLVNPSSSDDDHATARTAPLSEFPEGSNHRKLIDALREARVLGYDNPDESEQPMVRVTHEALLNHWTAARAQIDQDREHYRALRRIEAATEIWAAQDKSGEFLLQSGAQLSEAVALRDAWAVAFKPDVAQFVRRSIRADRKRRNRRLRMVSAAAVVLAIFGAFAVGAALYATEQQGKAERDQRAAQDAAETLVSAITTGVGQATGVSTSMVEEMLRDSEAVLDRLRQGAADPMWLKKVRAHMLLGFADAYGKSGDQEARLKSAEEAQMLATELVLDSPEGELTDLLGSAHAALGDAWAARSRFDEAESAYRKALNLRRILKDESAGDVQQSRTLAAVKQKLGDLELARGHPKPAHGFYVSAWTDLNALPKGDSEVQRDIMVTLNKIAYADIALGDLAKAQSGFEEASDIADALATANQTKRAQRDIAVARYNLGSVMTSLYLADGTDRKTGKAARSQLRTARDVTLSLIAEDPSNIVLKRDLARIKDRMGQLKASRSFGPAAADFTEAAELTKETWKLRPDSIDLWSDLIISLEHLGDVSVELAHLDAAQAAYDTAVEMHTDVVSRRPGDAIAIHALGGALIRRARMIERGPDPSAAISAWLQAHETVAGIREIDAGYTAAIGDEALTANNAAWRMILPPEAAGAEPLRALALAQKAVEVSQRTDPRFIDTLAAAHFALGNRNQARLICAEALDLAEKQLSPDARTIAEHCARYARSAK